MSSSSLYIKFETWRCPHLDWGTVLSTKRKMAFSEGSWMRFLMIHMNWATVMSEGTRYFLLSMSTIWDPQTFSTITWNAQVNRSVPVFGAAHAQSECPTFEERTPYMFIECAGQERKSHSIGQTWSFNAFCSVCGGLCWKAEGYRFKSRCGQNLGGVLVVGGGARTPSEHCCGTSEQGPEPPNAPLPHLGVYPDFTHVQLAPEGNNADNESHLCNRK